MKRKRNQISRILSCGRNLFAVILLLVSFTTMSQTIMFDDFTYTGVNDSQLPVFNKWTIINGVSGPPSGGQYSRNNITFIADPASSANKLMTLSTTVNGQTKATTHARIETSGFEYFEGTYAARVYLTDNPFTYKDANIQTFYTIVSSALGPDGSRYSELDIVEYMAADKWGISPDNQVLYTTSYHKYIADPWQAWKTYFASKRSWAGWHTFIASCTDGVNVKYWIDDIYLGSHSVTDSESQAGLPVYPRSPMQIAFANWIWNNVTGSSTADRTTTMQVDWVLFYKSQEVSRSQIDALVTNYRSQGLQRRNLAGQTVITNPCTVPAQPGTIAGSTTVTSGSSQTYSIAAVNGATAYTWTLPSGWSGASTTTSVTTTAGSTGGTISVRANNACGASTASALAVTVSACNVPAQPAAVTGSTAVTSGSSQTYSVAAVSGATAYTWTLPSGWSGASSTTSITTTAGSTGGVISVKANNACGASVARTLTVTVAGASANLALNKSATVSSIEGTGFEGNKAVDGNAATRWATVEGVDPQWISVDLGATYAINQVKITWEAAYATAYQIQISADGSSWTAIKSVTGNTSLANDHSGLSGTGRYIRINGTARGTAYGYSIYELEVYGTSATDVYTRKIEAESYTNMQGVQIEPTVDAGEETSVGYIDVTDWIVYGNINFPTSGVYTVEYRVASLNGGGQLNLNLNAAAIDLGTIEVPATGGWQNWTTISHTVTITAGTYNVGIYASVGGWNLNWLRITKQGSNARMAAVEILSEKTAEEAVELYPNPVETKLSIKAWSDFKGGQIRIINMSGKEILSGKIENDTIDVSALPSGIYILQLSKDQRSVVKKFSKK